MISLVLAVIVTTLLAVHARNEMIKNIYENSNEQNAIDRRAALEIITQKDLLKDLKYKKYSVCMHIGELYEAAGDYKDAQYAYELAVSKAKPGFYNHFYRLLCVLLEQDKFSKSQALIENIKDYNDKNLIKFKTRAYITIGDKYYSIGKFISAAKSYEKAEFYYCKFSRRDKTVEASLNNRIVNSYIQAADVLVKTGLNTDAIRFLKKAEKYAPDDFNIKYKLAIVLSDTDPEKAVEYLEPLLEKRPQDIDYSIYGNALLKAANIADLDGRPTQAKYYRYKIHSIDMFINRKVVYKNDIETTLDKFIVRKILFTYPLKAKYSFKNISNTDIINLYADFVLNLNNKPLETITIKIANKNKPLYSNGYESNDAIVTFKRKIFTRKELENYTIKIYLYKDDKFKTLISEFRIPQKTYNAEKD